MAEAQLDHVLRHIRRVVLAADEAIGDGELLARFVARRDGAAFAALVRRHGPLVWGVCRRALGHDHDAEDAFQATFLVLARKAASVRAGGALGSWLYEVAHHVAVRARAAAARRRERQEAIPDMPQPERAPEAVRRELLEALDVELGRLPEKYRAPLVLCYLQGWTHEQAAREIGVPAGSMSRLLRRALALLRSRLARRGAALPGAALAAVLAEQAATARVPLALMLSAGQGGATGAVPATATALAEGVINAMTATKLKLGIALIAALTVLAAGAGLAASGGGNGPPDGSLARAEAPERVLPLAPPIFQDGFDPPFPEPPPDPPPPTPTEGKGNDSGKGDPRERGPQGAAPRDAHGDPLPASAVGRLGTVRFRHGPSIKSLTFSPDGKLIASGSEQTGEKVVKLWDAATGEERACLKGHTWTINAVAFAPDGKSLASAGADGTVRLWEVSTGKEGRSFTVAPVEPFSCVAWARDGKTVFAAGGDEFNPKTGGTVRCWDVATGEERAALREDAGGVFALALSADGKALASGGAGKKVCLWDPATGKFRDTITAGGAVHAVAFAPDGKTLAWGEESATVRLYDLGEKKEVRRLAGKKATGQSRGAGDVVTGLAFAPDGKTLYSLGDYADGTVRRWDVAKGEELSGYSGRPGDGLALALAPDGKALAVGGRNGLIRVWDPATGKDPHAALGDQAGVTSLAWSPDGGLIATAGKDGVVRLWDPAAKKETRRIPGHRTQLCAVTFAPDGKTVASGGGYEPVRLWDAATGKQVKEIPAASSAGALAFAPDGKTLAVGDFGQAVWLWDVATAKEVRRLKADPGQFTSVGFAPDGKVLFCAGYGQPVRLWDPGTGKELRAFDTGQSPAVAALTPDGKTLAVGQGTGEAILWDALTGKERRRWQALPPVRAIALSPDGRLLAVGDAGGVGLWEVATGDEVARFVGHTAAVRGVVFSPDGRVLASGAEDATVLLWDATCRDGQRVLAKLSADDLDRLWGELAEGGGAKAHRAAWALASAPESAVPFLRARFAPAQPADDKRLARLIRELDDDSFDTREKASAELARLGTAAEAALRRALEDKPSAEVTARARVLLDKLGAGDRDREGLRAARAVAALEYAGTREARQALEEVAKGGNPDLAAQAKAALGRLARRPEPR